MNADPQAAPLQERLRGAFSLQRNVRALFVPASGHLAALDGVRALSILWVVVFHAGWYAAWNIPPPTYGAMLASPLMLPAWRGDFGVDVFFVLSGFLIAGMLVDEQARQGRVRLGLFYVRRLLRLWPALVVAVLLDLALGDPQRGALWANLLYVSNFLPFARVTMGWTWSLAIEEQFYLVCPWLVLALRTAGLGARLTTTAALAAGLCGLGAWVVVAGDFHAWDAEVVITRPLEVWARAFDALYTKPWMRAGPLLAGVSAAYVYRAPRVMEALGRSGARGWAGLVAALALAVASTHWPLAAGAPRALEVTFLAAYRTTFGASVAYGILLVLSTHPAGRLLGRALSSRVLYPVSQLAYSAYLINPIVTTQVDRFLAPLVWLGKAEPMALFLPFDAGCTFVAAAALHVLVERPLMNLRPR